jgi:hypothetical protein
VWGLQQARKTVTARPEKVTQERPQQNFTLAQAMETRGLAEFGPFLAFFMWQWSSCWSWWSWDDDDDDDDDLEMMMMMMRKEEDNDQHHQHH